MDTWTEIWHYFSSVDTKYQRLYSTGFEYDVNRNEIEVHIAIKE